MDESIYEVTRDEYVGFLGEFRKEAGEVETQYQDNITTLSIISKKTGKKVCARKIDQDTGEEVYYIFNMPDDDERCAAKPFRKITLDTKEEVQAFFDVLNQLTKEQKDDRNI